MDYVSTRNKERKVSAAYAIANGIAPDGGLYCPTAFPALTDADWKTLAESDYKGRSALILGKFLTDFTAEEHHALDTYEDDYTNLTTNEVLSCLGEDYRSIVILKVCEDMTFGEIAAVLGISENTVKTRFYRAVKLLKTYMEEDGHE